MKEKINQLKEAYCNTKTDEQYEEIGVQMQELYDQNPDSFAEAMCSSLKESVGRATKLAIKEKLKDITPAVSLAYISKTYFKKSENWIYQRLNGNRINGKTAAFTHDEIDTLKFALNDLSQRLSSVSVSL